MTYYVGQRLSLKGQLCTVRYLGSVTSKPGEWLGVEWDDPLRGKHNGVHDGVTYFKCRSTSPTAASFLRPNQPRDKSRTFMEALREKYASGDDTQQHETIYFSTKQAEEVGFDKFAKRQAELRGIHVLVLDHMRIRHDEKDPDTNDIEEVCKEVTDLDIGSNLFETIREIYDLCRRLPKLRSLTLDGNRFSTLDGLLDLPESAFSNVRTLSLSNTLLNWETEVTPSLERLFPGLQTLVANNNELAHIEDSTLPNPLRTLDLSGNEFEALSNVGCVAGTQVKTLILKDNDIARPGSPGQLAFEMLSSIRELDIRQNKIADWAFFNDLAASIPNLAHLRTTGNPLYQNLQSVEGKPLTSEDGYMLTIARLPSLETLNYSKVTEKERLNAEMYYLNQIAAELSRTSSQDEVSEIRTKHPRWEALCEEYGKPVIKRQRKADELDPNSLVARLVSITFTFGAQTWTESFPKAANMYTVLGAVGKRMGVMPLKLRLVWETGERDPSAREDGDAPDWWCSSGEEEDDGIELGTDEMMVERQVELVAGTMAVGAYIEGREARVRVEVKK